MLDRIKREPALVTGFVSSVIALVVAFGLHLSTGQVGAIMAVVGAALAFVTRSKVSPVAKYDAEHRETDYADDVA
jgi:hypothetical protein